MGYRAMVYRAGGPLDDLWRRGWARYLGRNDRAGRHWRLWQLQFIPPTTWLAAPRDGIESYREHAGKMRKVIECERRTGRSCKCPFHD